MKNRDAEVRRYARRAALRQFVVVVATCAAIFLVIRTAVLGVAGWVERQQAALEDARGRIVDPPKPPPAEPGEATPEEPTDSQPEPENPPESQPATPAANVDEPELDPSPSPEPTPEPTVPIESQILVDVTVTDAKWSVDYDQRYLPFTSSRERNYLWVQVQVENLTDDAHSTPYVTLVDADGDEIEGFAPFDDDADYKPLRILMPGKRHEGYWVIRAPDAALPVRVKFRTGDAAKVVEIE